MVVSLGMEGLCKCYGWAQPIITSTSASHDHTASYAWNEEKHSWILSWAREASDITCIETQLHPETNFWNFSHDHASSGATFPVHVRCRGRLKNSCRPLSHICESHDDHYSISCLYIYIYIYIFVNPGVARVSILAQLISG
jgi:hypothetical protein